jgi:ABC-type glycerol-3-phosphate transport system substrate-binding protein
VKSVRTAAIVVLLAAPLAACGDDNGADSITLVAYDSFPDEGPINDALAAFTEETGVDVELVRKAM